MAAAALPSIAYPPELPVSAHREQLLEAIGSHQVVVVAGETGSGKTTQLPKLCLELGRERIAHTQPRRLAARTVAARIAEELRVPLGEAVGYAVRFRDRSRRDTQVRLMTDGLLLAEIRRDKLLRRYDTIIVDEAHERSLNIDFLLGYLVRILPRRPDLKLIITSATIDPERFSRHFSDAPVVEVSGRTYPVEVRYRPVEDSDRDQEDAIADAVDELQREGPGDVLVFLSGEREIRDTADVLAGRLGSGVEVLPLYARLSAAEQQRIFRPHAKRRVVLATNVAETSLTVPGIRYVVDPGTARISRYSARLKVQRLPIEPISQASADQRKGRCGRTSDGICIRLYDEEELAERPRYTDPEILRTSLASVILQMAAVGLGKIEDFPFLDPPDRRQVRDGVRLLEELGALDDAGRLTKLGRRLADLPVDPRMARMVIEADRLGCAEEAIVIAAALSIQDPRERPSDKTAQADQLHARFADEDSDFVAYLNLWRHLRELQRQLSSNQFRKRCLAEHLHHLRIREWQDLVQQLREAAKGVGVRFNRTPAEPAEIHRALLSGLLSHIGLKDPRGREYQGARGARFAVFPGSGLFKKPPEWVMVAELVETTRLWGRTAARIDPKDVEPLAGHLVKRTYSEPRWEPRRGSVVATERVTLYGLAIVSDRTVAYGRIDPVLSRELFIRRALVDGEWETRHEFVSENRRRVEEVEALEHRARRRDILVDDQKVYEFFDARIPEGVVSAAHFDRWWREERLRDPQRLTFTREALVNADAAAAIDDRAWPASWRQGELTLDLSYRFEPGTEHDGVTVHVPLQLLGQLRADRFEWLVPGLREELVTTLIRSLPKELRRPLVPVPETAARVLARLEPRRRPLVDDMAAAIEALRGVRVPRDAWDLERLPAHLRMTFRVEDERRGVLAEGNDLAQVRARVRPQLRAELTAAAARLERTGLRTWDIGSLPREVTLRDTGHAVAAYPALVDEGETVGVAVLETPAAQRAAMRAGTRRLLMLTVPSPVRFVQDRLGNAGKLALSAAPHGSVAAVLHDAVVASVETLMAAAGGPAWDEQGFARLRDHVAGHLADTTAEVVAAVVRILGAAREVERQLEPLTAVPLQPARADVRAQLHRLVFPGFVAATGTARLTDVERYLRAAARRLERLPDATAVDRDRMNAVHELERAYRARLAASPGAEALREVPWMLEELRVSHFAQSLGTRGPISAKRIRRALDEAAMRV
jgi:ATP-dependent helicase HrpA